MSGIWEIFHFFLVATYTLIFWFFILLFILFVKIFGGKNKEL